MPTCAQHRRDLVVPGWAFLSREAGPLEVGQRVQVDADRLPKSLSEAGREHDPERLFHDEQRVEIGSGGALPDQPDIERVGMQGVQLS